MASSWSVLTVTVALLLCSSGCYGQQAMVTQFDVSMTPPESMTLTFNVAVDPSTCDTSKITLQGSSQADAYTFSMNGTCSAGSTSLQVQVDLPDWINVQTNINIGTSVSNTFLTLDFGFISSTDNFLSEPTGNALQVTTFTSNTNPPTVSQSALFLDGFFAIGFSEAINVIPLSASVVTIGYSLRTSPSITATLTLSEMSIVQIEGGVIQIMLNPQDLATLQFNALVSGAFTFSLPGNLVTDGNSQTNPAVTNMAISTVTPDSTPPRLEQFDIDLNIGNMVLSFNEPIDTARLDLSNVIVGSPAPNTTQYTLNNSMLISMANMSTILTIRIDGDVLNQIKGDPTLCLTNGDCFVRIGVFSVYDIAGNTMTMLDSEYIAPNNFIPDTTPPSLLSYSIDLGEGTITLQFSEAVERLLFFPAGISLTDTSGQTPLDLTDSDIQSVENFNTIFVLTIEETVLNAIKSYQTNGGIRLNLDPTAAQDGVGNMVSMVTNLAPSNVVLDDTPPVLVEFEMSVPENRQITLTFDESVMASSVDFSTITITFVSPLLVDTPFTLTGGSAAMTTNSDTITVTMTTADFNSVMRFYNESYYGGMFMLTATTGLINDLFGNPSSAVLRALVYSNIPVFVDGFSLDLDQGFLIVNFTETVDSMTINFQNMYLAGELMLGPSGYSLNGSSLIGFDFNMSEIIIQIPQNVLTQLRFDTEVCTDIMNCFSFIGANSVEDENGESLTNMPIRAQASEIIPDTTSPDLLALTLDLNVGQVLLTFDEPVDGTTLQPQYLYVWDDRFERSTSFAEGILVSLTSLNREMAIDIRPHINEIEVVSFNSSFLQITLNGSFISDLNGNGALAVNQSDALQPTTVIVDVSPPHLTQFIAYPPERQSFLMVFDEYVRPASFNGAQLMLSFNTLDLVFQYNASYFTTGTVTQEISTNVTYSFSATEFTAEFEQMYTDAYYNGYIGLTANMGLIEDLDFNLLEEIETAFRSNVDSMFEDIIRPRLQRYDFDLNSGSLVMSFSENVTLLTVPGLVTFQNTPTSPTHMYSLTQEGTSSTDNGIITLTLTNVDLNTLKSIPELASLRANTYLTLGQNIVEDLNGNTLDIRTGALEVTNFTPDTVNPQLVSSELDLNQGVLTLGFNEPIEPNGVDLSRISLVRESSTVAGSLVVEGTISSPRGAQLTIQLGLESLNELKFTSDLCSARENCYLFIQMNTFNDINGNPAQVPSASFMVGSLVQDTTPPSLTSFDLDLTLGTVRLVFSETINVGSVSGSQISLAGANGNPFTLSSAVFSHADSFDSRVYLLIPASSSALNQAKLLGIHGSSNVFLSLTSSAATDVRGNPITAISPSEAYPVTTLTADLSRPRLLNFSPGLPGTNLITFTFDEFVNSSTWNGAAITMTLSNPDGVFSYSNFNEGTLAPDVGDQLTYTFGGSMSVEPFLTQYERAYDRGFIMLTAGANLIMDVFGNTAVGSVTPLVYNMSRFDNVRPEFLSFTLDLTLSRLALTFSEPVTLATSTVGTVTFQNTADTPQIVYTLGDELSNVVTTDNVVMATISTVDITALSVNVDLATAVSNTFLRLDPTFATDDSDNTLQGRAAGLQASLVVVPQPGSSSLDSWTLDMDSGELLLSFTGTVDASSLSSTDLTIQSSPTSAAISYSLGVLSGLPMPTDGQFLIVQVSTPDLNALKSNAGLATSDANAYLSTREGFVNDIFGNAIPAVPSSNALAVSGFDVDTTPPGVTRFQLDMNAGFVILSFNEPVDSDTIDPTLLTIQSSGSTPDSSLTLTGGVVNSASLLTSNLRVTMTEDDLNNLKTLSNLATSEEDSFLMVAAGSVADTFSNSISSVVIQAATYQRDIVTPVLNYWDLDLRGGAAAFVTMAFNEPVANEPTQTLPGITLQDAMSNPATQLVLSTLETLTQSDPFSLRVQLRAQYREDLLSGEDIGSSSQQLYLSLGQDAIRDLSNNPVPAIPGNGAMRVRYLYRNCEGVSYLDLNSGTCVNCSSVCVGGCSGVSPLAGDGGCDMCRTLLVYSNDTQERCVDSAECPNGYYDNTAGSTLSPLATRVCSPCAPTCAVCTSPTQCTACQSAYVTATLNNPTVQCLTSCEISGPESPCENCHAQCDGCTGPGPSSCVQCREASQEVAGVTTCIPQCSDDQYLYQDSNNDYRCGQCHIDCNGCTGPTQAQCDSCRVAYEIRSGVRVCLSQCSITDNYINSMGECVPCHDQCIGCTGPTSFDCLACAQTSRMVDGRRQCIPACETGQDFDEASETCVVQQTTLIIAVVVGIVVALLIIVVVIVAIATCVIYYKRRGKYPISRPLKENVLFVDAKLTNEEDISAM